ncbi:ABC transporter ATP-binding protein [Mycobacterium alsense]|uniref:ABC transporter ATP-binding protein n=1 Tax=Mycobacterium alsense TaxID=324058 RepID=A0ABD6NWB2_9MYCO|nr:ATP-binding cassette domain-containing protein [Mycobacterium alsense]OBG32158.1 ABC transporter ATP-binding protein [Mycobacterium alsense]
MNTVAPPVLTVFGDGSKHTFRAGHDVVVGSDLRADVRITHPLISRTHLVLRFDNGRWLAIDNGSPRGTFVGRRRARVIDICHGRRINIGNPDGPCLVFEIGPDTRAGDGPPATDPMRAVQPQRNRLPRPPRWARGVRNAPSTPDPPTLPASALRPRPTPAPAPRTGPVNATQPAPVAPPGSTQDLVVQHSAGDPDKPEGFATIGRATSNDIVVYDVMASRHHAIMVPTPMGTEIRDARSVNGTFVNGVRVGSALLTEGDVVTIGNVDLVFTGTDLVHRSGDDAATGGLEVAGVQYRIDGKELLDNVSLTARPGTLTAIIGGSGAGKTTLARLIAGYTRPSAGSVTFEGHDIHAEYATLRTRIGMVPQDDVVHRQLTVNQALGYAAELRLPPDTSADDRARAVARVLDELNLTEQADTRVDKLSGGQRKRASVALELLTGPSLLILDEPTTGLDPALDSQVMMMLRQLADAGRTVLVVTHSVAHLDLCDQLLLLAPGGKTAYFGPPDEISSVTGTTTWAEIFVKVGADPDEAKRRFLARKRPEPELPKAQPRDLGEPVNIDVRRQFSTIARRQVRLVVSDSWYTVFLAVLPFVIGLLALTVPGTTGFGLADPNGKTPAEPAQILVLLCVGAVFMGTALTIRDLVGERPIFRREQAFGLSTGAYLLAKVAVFCVFAIAQAACATTITIIGKGTPTRGAVLLGNPTLELYVATAATCIVAAIIGLVLSAVARTSDHILPLLVVAIMAQLVFSSGVIPVTNRPLIDQLSWLTPARWGFAACASTIDLNHVEPSPFSPKDSHWNHTAGAWSLDMAMLLVLGVAYSAIVWWRIRLRR